MPFLTLPYRKVHSETCCSCHPFQENSEAELFIWSSAGEKTHFETETKLKWPKQCQVNREPQLSVKKQSYNSVFCSQCSALNIGTTRRLEKEEKLLLPSVQGGFYQCTQMAQKDRTNWQLLHISKCLSPAKPQPKTESERKLTRL